MTAEEYERALAAKQAQVEDMRKRLDAEIDNGIAAKREQDAFVEAMNQDCEKRIADVVKAANERIEQHAKEAERWKAALEAEKQAHATTAERAKFAVSQHELAALEAIAILSEAPEVRKLRAEHAQAAAKQSEAMAALRAKLGK